jgi:hypothetical protein
MNASIDRLVEQLRVVLSLPDLKFNEDRVCCLFRPGELDLQLEWVPDQARLMLLSPLGLLGNDPQRARALLAANFLFGGTRGETLSLEPDSDEVFLCAGIDLDEVSTLHAIEMLNRFIDTAKQWRAALAGGRAPLNPLGFAGSIRV